MTLSVNSKALSYNVKLGSECTLMIYPEAFGMFEFGNLLLLK